MHQALIIQHLFQVSSLEDVSRERLESFVEAYPTFGIGHYLLSCKLQAEGSDKFLPETQRTCLYFSNPLWLQWLLQNTNGVDGAHASGEASPAEPVFVEAASLETVHVEPEHVESPHVESAYVEAVHVESVYVEPVYTEPVQENPMQEEQAQEEPAHIEQAYTEPAPVENAAAGNVVTMAEEAFAAPDAGDDHVGSVPTAVSAEEPSAAEQLLRSIEEARGLRESFTDPETAPAAEELVTPEAAEVAPVQENTPIQEHIPAQEEPIRDEEAPFVLEETEEQSAIQETAAVVEAQPVVEQSAAETQPAVGQPAVELPAAETQPAEVQTVSMEQPAAVQPIPAEQPKPAMATQDFLFEPYHTIDYFASQGIKLALDENPQDSLGKQLKSFTEWLKVMRRLPQKDREVVPDRVIEETIQTIAAHSIEGKDVVTETMAEVLAKQGMREKARVVYEKLSLLNPDKRAYFAAKIEQLNIP